MKKKQVVIRIMFIIGLSSAAFIGYSAVKADAMNAVALTTSKTIELHNEKMSEAFSTELESLSNELNTKVESINDENTKLREVIEDQSKQIKDQSKQIEELSEGIKRLGVTFQ